MNKQKLGIIGVGVGQELLIKKAKQMGIYTVCFGYGDLTAKDICDEFHLIPITEQASILEICKEHNIDGVISAGNDNLMPIVNYVARELGLVGNSEQATINTVNKASMRNVLLTNGLPVPKFYNSKNIHDAHGLNYPFMVKPVESSSGRGVALVNNDNEYSSAYNYSLNYSKEVILEEYFEGRQFSVEMLSNNGKHEFIGLTEEFYTEDFVECNLLEPGRLDNSTLLKLIEIVVQTLDAIDYKNGASHSEVRVNDKNEFCIIELAGRMGSNRAELIEIAYGIDFLKALINVSLGCEVEISAKKHTSYVHLKLIKNDSEFELLKDLIEKDKLEYYGINNNVDKSVDVVDMTKVWGYFIKKEDSIEKCLNYINF